MSFWSDHLIEQRVVALFQEVPEWAEGHHLGRPFVTTYHLVIAMARAPPDVRQGGSTGERAPSGEHAEAEARAAQTPLSAAQRRVPR